MALSVRRGVAACAVAVLAVSGCGASGPTAAEAGETLKHHITEVMKRRRALDVQITDPGGRDIPCGEGKAKRTFAAVGRDRAPGTEPGLLNDLLMGALFRVARYRIVEDEENAPIRLAGDEYRTVIILDSRRHGQYGMRGETNCLPVS
ncbi:hypothetical protein ACWDTT_13235 [Streptosporangium sandarakinum]|uniref:hypothetical protein n=1 Tax=Streptosporangium sandarakinum TaxID=1260955 RepID=UPI0037A98FE6